MIKIHQKLLNNRLKESYKLMMIPIYTEFGKLGYKSDIIKINTLKWLNNHLLGKIEDNLYKRNKIRTNKIIKVKKIKEEEEFDKIRKELEDYV